MPASFVSYRFTDYISLTALLFLCFHSSPSLKLNFWVPILLSHSSNGLFPICLEERSSLFLDIL
ncbi:hypothetical protein LEP1GSC161_0668 [Leptospira santarosai str. CBC1416]|uniref:Uncharacterized protein n=1 Tax=Leptospira santarosai str. CBC1416 TaxID=1193059 RepID=M6VNP5_9LEPT|nr:hypothetical protein LEP1GSC161_0661 [Leptospira santarosai str. CBC1416]EMO56761.1 hypothetical protein LEP1GSC161_0668 [Leptospira santarosai str. CBC1416]